MVNNGHVAHTRKDRQEAVKLYQTTDLSAEEIGARFGGVSRQTIHRWIAEAGVELRGPMGPRNREPEGPGVDVDNPIGQLLSALAQARREVTAEIETNRREIAQLRGVIETNWTVVHAEIARVSTNLTQAMATQQIYLDLLRQILDERGGPHLLGGSD